jgi:hypothetical protein
MVLHQPMRGTKYPKFLDPELMFDTKISLIKLCPLTIEHKITFYVDLANLGVLNTP